MPEERAALRPKPVRKRRVPIRLQVLLATGRLLSLMTISMAVAAASSRSLRILLACFLSALAIGCAVSFWLVRSIAMPASRLMAILRVDVPSRGSA